MAQKDKLGQGRLIRWIADMAMIDYDIVHISGEENVLADVISRMAKFPKDPVPAEDDPDDFDDPAMPSLLTRIVGAVRVAARSGDIPVDHSADSSQVGAVRVEHNLRTVMDEDWVQPAARHIRAYAGKDGQRSDAFLALAQEQGAVFDDEECVWKVRGAVLIPAGVLRTMLMAQAHSYGAGHRGADTTTQILTTVERYDR